MNAKIILVILSQAILLQIAYSRKSNNQHPLSILDQKLEQFFHIEDELWEEIHYGNVDVGDVTTNTEQEEQLELSLIKRYYNFTNEIKHLDPYDLNYDAIPAVQDLWSWGKIYSDLRSIYALFEAFKRFQRKQLTEETPSPKQAWKDIARTILFDSQSAVVESMNRVRESIIKEKLFDSIKRDANYDRCNLRQSPNQLLYNLYNTIALTELKGYTMMQFSYMVLAIFERGNYTQEAALSHARYEQHRMQLIGVVRRVMGDSDNSYWRCDPKKHIKDETYTDLTKLLQAIVENEVNLNNLDTCMESCPYYQYTKAYGCFKDTYCKKQTQCKGEIVNCQFIDSDMWICPGNETNGRRFDYIEYENGRTLGQKKHCSNGLTKVDSWWRWLFWHCSYCVCFCDEATKSSDRYWNLRSVLSNVKENRVVTGVRFVKKHRVIHLQIQEGQLLPGAIINETTVHWLPVDEYRIHDTDVQMGRDYHKMTWMNKAIDLDDVKETTDNYLVTGLRFRVIGTHLNLEVRVSKFDFEKGTLTDPDARSIWIANDNTDANLDQPRNKLRLQRPDIPTKAPLPSQPDSQHDQFIEFTHSDLDRDAGQTTVPYLDAQPTTSEIPVPLIGLGLYHKGQYGYGGFVAPKIFTYNYLKHININLPNEEEYEFSINAE